MKKYITKFRLFRIINIIMITAIITIVLLVFIYCFLELKHNCERDQDTSHIYTITTVAEGYHTL
ncbi:hypothetical protein ES705_36153 [subsurface metagenome]